MQHLSHSVSMDPLPAFSLTSPMLPFPPQWMDGELQLVETKFTSRKMNKSLFTYLERCHSYPAFLSSLTLDLFSKQTMC